MQNIIPPFDPTTGVLPLLHHTSKTSGVYEATLPELVDRFAFNKARRDLLTGLLNYRKELHRHVKDGLQWICGSFVEDAENFRGQPPRDLDVISILCIKGAAPQPLRDLGMTSQNRHTGSSPKARFLCDAYHVYMEPGQEADMQIALAESICDWYGQFAHQRESFRWKGIVSISLDPRAAQDQEARQLLVRQVVP